MGESLPIALEAGARAMGKTQAEFIQLVSTGKVLSKDFMLPFARQMRMMVRDNNALSKATEKLTARQQRLISSVKDLIDQAFQGGLANSIGSIFELMTRFVRFVTPVVKSLAIGLGHIVDITATAASAILGLVSAVFSLGDAGPNVLVKGWKIVKIFFMSLAAAIWDVIGSIQYLSEVLEGKRDLNFSNLIEKNSKMNMSAKDVSLSPQWILDKVSSIAALNSSSNASAITVQGDVVIKHDGSQTVTDNVLTQLGM